MGSYEELSSVECHGFTDHTVQLTASTGESEKQTYRVPVNGSKEKIFQVAIEHYEEEIAKKHVEEKEEEP